ncbi:MAG: hypothetical protein V4490_04420, partial [Pseudomonadota bacterium]
MQHGTQRSYPDTETTSQDEQQNKRPKVGAEPTKGFDIEQLWGKFFTTDKQPKQKSINSADRCHAHGCPVDSRVRDAAKSVVTFSGGASAWGANQITEETPNVPPDFDASDQGYLLKSKAPAVPQAERKEAASCPSTQPAVMPNGVPPKPRLFSTPPRKVNRFHANLKSTNTAADVNRIFQSLLISEEDPTEVNDEGDTPLHIVLDKGYIFAAVTLIHHFGQHNPAELDRANHAGWPPLLIATRLDNTRLINALL